jgi:hypothetical protein
MGFLDKKLNEEKLNELSFLDCINYLRVKSKDLSYIKGSNNTYWEAKEIIAYLIKRYCKECNFTSENYKDNEIGGLLYSANFDLGDYSKYDKGKVIKEFKLDMEMCIEKIIAKIGAD